MNIPIEYNRPLLVAVVAHHWPTPTSRCSCGWGQLGRSFAEHLADAYEHEWHLARRRCRSMQRQFLESGRKA